MEHKSEDQLSQPVFGDGQMEEHLVRDSVGRREGFVEGLAGSGGLLVNEFPACLGLVNPGEGVVVTRFIPQLPPALRYHASA